MKRLFVLISMLLGMASTSWGGACPTATFTAYTAPGFSCTIGALTFSNFYYVGSGLGGAVGVSGDGVAIAPVGSGFQFVGPFNVGPGQSIVGYISFSVTTLNGNITGFTSSMAGFGSSAQGFIQIYTTGSNGAETLLDSTVSGGVSNATAYFAGVSTLNISEPISATAPGSTDSAAVSQVLLQFIGPNPVPFIDSLQPVAAAPGATLSQLMIWGANFVDGAMVSLSGEALIPASVTSNQIVLNNVTVNSSPMTTLVTVFNPNSSPLVGASNVAFFPVTKLTASVNTSRTDFGNLVEPVSVVAGDFNGDGVLDVAVVDNPDNAIKVLLGNGDGTFSTAASPATGNFPVSIALGDFNGDGKPDLAVANAKDNTISVLLGNGDGTFSTASSPATGSFPISVAVGDLNMDGKLDLAVANAVDGTVTILLGDGDGTFSTGATAATGNDPSSVAVGDFNGDGKLDLAVANSADNTVTVLLGNGDGTFSTAAAPATGISPSAIVVGDLNGDGKLDLAAANFVDGTITILLGNGDGTFVPVNSPGAGSPTSLAVGDFNGDGFLDLVVPNNKANTLTILLGDGRGNFIAASSPGVGNDPFGVVVGDFNGDGRLDFAVINNGSGSVSVLLQASLAAASPQAGLSFGNQPAGTTSNPLTATLMNNGSAPLKVTGVNASSNFNTTAKCVGVLQAGSSCNESVTFTPTAMGLVNGTLTFIDNSGNVAGSTQTLSLTGTGTAATFQLTVTTAGTGTGTVTSSPAGINCPGACMANFAGGAQVTLTESPGSGSSFGGWNGACSGTNNSCSVTVTAAMSVTASFSANADFSLMATPASVTVSAGTMASFTITATGQGGFTSAISLACTSGMPPHASCQFSPGSITPGANPATSTLTIATTASSASLSLPALHGRPGLRYAMWMMLPAMLFSTMGWAAPKRRTLPAFCLCFLLLSGCLLQVACGTSNSGSTGGGGGSGGTTPGTYNITITGTAGATQHTAIVKLVVQ